MGVGVDLGLRVGIVLSLRVSLPARSPDVIDSLWLSDKLSRA